MELQRYDYGTVPVAAADLARGAAERIRVRMQRTAEDIVAVGKELSAVKAALPHGAFLPWVEAEFGMTERTARNFMRVAERYGKSEMIADLTPTALYELAAPSTPETVQQEVEAKVDAGESVTVAEIKRLKREAADAQQKAANAQQEAERQKAKADSLVDGQAAIIQKAEQDARAQVQTNLDEARRAEAEAKRKLADETKRLKELAETAEQRAMKAAQAKAEDLAASELAKLGKQARKAREEEAQSRKAVNRLSENADRMKKRLDEYDRLNRQIENRDIEIKMLRDEFTSVNEAIASAMVQVLDIEHNHGDEVLGKAQNTARICRQFAEALETIGSPAATPTMKVVSNE